MINLVISIYFANSTQAIKFETDFSLNHSNISISSLFSLILKISARLCMIHSDKNNSTCFSQNQSISNQFF
ncbi:hypothetical protein GW891_05380, partial [bacterium]|nr:hypothetical protein [bacterium]